MLKCNQVFCLIRKRAVEGFLLLLLFLTKFKEMFNYLSRCILLKSVFYWNLVSIFDLFLLLVCWVFLFFLSQTGGEELTDPFLVPLEGEELLDLPPCLGMSQGWNAWPKGSPAAPRPKPRLNPGCHGGQTSSSMPNLWRNPVGVFFFLESKDFSMSFSRADSDAELVDGLEGEEGLLSVVRLFALLFSSSISSRLSSSSFFMSFSFSVSLSLFLTSFDVRCLLFLDVLMTEEGVSDGLEVCVRWTEPGLDPVPEDTGDDRESLSVFRARGLLALRATPSSTSSSSEQSQEEDSEETEGDQRFEWEEEGKTSLSLARAIHFSTADKDAETGKLFEDEDAFEEWCSFEWWWWCRDPLSFLLWCSRWDRDEDEGMLLCFDEDDGGAGSFMSKDLSIKLWRADRHADDAEGPFDSLLSVFSSSCLSSSGKDSSLILLGGEGLGVVLLSRMLSLLPPEEATEGDRAEESAIGDEEDRLQCFRWLIRCFVSTFVPHSSQVMMFEEDDNRFLEEVSFVPFASEDLLEEEETSLWSLDEEGEDLGWVISILSNSSNFLTGRDFFLLSLVCLLLPWPPSVILLRMCSL